MLQQDYIMRLIREFFAALQRLLEKNEIEDKTKALHEMYEQYLGPYEFYQDASMDEVMQSFEKYPEEQRIHRMEMLAELYYVESGMRALPFNDILLRRALPLFEWIDRHSGVYSFDRLRKMDDIKKRLNECQHP
jgi:hypothetical protein